MMVMTMRIWRSPFPSGQRRPARVVILPRSKDLIRCRGKLRSESAPLCKPTAPKPPVPGALAGMLPPQLFLYQYQLSDLLITIKEFPSQAYLQLNKQTALKKQKLMVGFQVSVGGVRCLDRNIKLCSCI